MNAVIESGRAAAGALHAPRLRVFHWLVRRELWEHRGIWLAPLICAAIILAAAVFGQVDFGAPQSPGEAATGGSFGTAATFWARAALLALGTPFYFVLLFTQFFYALNSLYEDRKDRSVLFWKSLPASDLETVLSKLFVAAVVMPLLAVAITVVTQMLLALVAVVRVDEVAAELSRAFGPRAGEAAEAFVHALGNPRLWLLDFLPRLLLLALAYGLWTLPIVGFALLVSAASPRSPAVIAFLIPAAIGLAEKLAFNSDWLSRQIGIHAFGAIVGSGTGEVVSGAGGPTGLAPVARHFASQVASTDLWGGLVVGVVLVAAAVWARRYRDENT